MASQTRAVLFDIDGTLIDSVDAHARAWQEIFTRYGHEISFDKIRHQIGKGGDQLLPVFLPRNLLDEKGTQIESERSALFKEKYLPHIRPFPNVRALFERVLAAGLKAGVASSAKGDELSTYLKIAEIDDLVEETVSSDEAERSKPHPDIFEAALEKLQGLRPQNVIAVGDTPYDAEAAGKAGLRTLGLLCGGFPETELRTAGCVAIYQDPADLLANFDASPLAARS